MKLDSGQKNQGARPVREEEAYHTGREVQRAHMHLAKRLEPWPVGELPAERGSITALDVLASPEGPARDALIDEWARSVWAAYDGSRERVSDLLRRRGIV